MIVLKGKTRITTKRSLFVVTCSLGKLQTYPTHEYNVTNNIIGELWSCSPIANILIVLLVLTNDYRYKMKIFYAMMHQDTKLFLCFNCSIPLFRKPDLIINE